MLNRRYLRIKVLQALYAFWHSDGTELKNAEKELFFSINKVYELYIYILLLLVELRDVAEAVAEDAKQKHLPTSEDLNPRMNFINNRFLRLLSENKELQKQTSNRKINWAEEHDFVRRLFNKIRQSEEYQEYVRDESLDFDKDQKFIETIYRKFIANNELLEHHLEERSIYWVDDMYLINSVVVRTIRSWNSRTDVNEPLMPLYKDEVEDREFAKRLLDLTILNNQEYEQKISEKTRNWEVERIAHMDILLMKMALCEVLNFPTIPVKVTLNEYIEISKLYSTPKSSIFINGVLDKLLADYRRNDMIRKTGRGLIE